MDDGAVAGLDVHARVTTWSATAVEMFGWEAEDVIGMPFAPAVGAGTVELLRASISEVIHAGVPRGGMLRLVHRDTSPVDVIVSLQPAADPTGKAPGVTAIFIAGGRRREDTRRERLLSELSVSFAESLDYATTLRTVARLAVSRIADWCSIDLIEDSGLVQAVELAARDESTERRLRELVRRFPPDPEKDGDITSTAIRTGRMTVIPVVTSEMLSAAARDDDHARLLRELAPHSIIVAPLLARERTLGVLSLFRSGVSPSFTVADVALAEELTERAALAVDNARLYRAAQRSLAVRDEIVGIVAHDLRNPLSTILMATRMIEESLATTDTNATARKMCEIIARAARGMNRLSHDLLDVAKIESGTLRLELRSHPPADLLAEAQEQLDSLAAERGILLSTEVQNAAPPVRADRDCIVRVFSNLVGNALKATAPGGRITLTARADGDMIRFGVADTGSGIPPDQLPHVFDRFWQARTTHRAGAGLGLTICSGIVRAHGGTIWVESEEGVGTVFHFTVPEALATH